MRDKMRIWKHVSLTSKFTERSEPKVPIRPSACVCVSTTRCSCTSYLTVHSVCSSVFLVPLLLPLRKVCNKNLTLTWQCWVCLFLTQLITMLIMSLYVVHVLFLPFGHQFFENNFMILIIWALTTNCMGEREPIFLITLVLDCVLCLLSYGTNNTIHFKKTSPSAFWDFEYWSLLL